MLHTYFSLNCTIFTLIHSTWCINVNLLSSPLFHALATFLLWRIVLIYQQMVPAAPRKKTPQSPERQRACFRWSCHEWKRRTWANHWCAQQSKHTYWLLSQIHPQQKLQHYHWDSKRLAPGVGTMSLNISNAVTKCHKGTYLRCYYDRMTKCPPGEV